MIFASAVMPTTVQRLPFLKQSIGCFLAQTFTDMELVIVAQGWNDEQLQILHEAATSQRVRYYTVKESRKAIGEVRNELNDAALGKVILHWDDDDWYAPQRAADEIGFLISSGKQVVGYHDMLYYREADDAVFKFRYSASKAMPFYATGTSQCYWKTFWEANKFAPVPIGEDSVFSITASRKGELASKDCNGMLVARTHTGSTSKPMFGHAQFPRVAKDQLPQLFLDTLQKV